MSFIVLALRRLSRLLAWTRKKGGMARAIVIGAGLAGLKAALDLREAGLDVLVLEARARVGGRTFSFRDPEDGTVLDNGQHVILGCCTEFLKLTHDVGVPDAVALPPTLAVPVYKNGKRSMLASLPAAGPLHLAAGMLRYRHLSPRGRITALKAAARLARGAPVGPLTFADWLRSQGHDTDDIASLWNLLAVSVFNADAAELDAGAAIRGFRFGFEGGPANAALGLMRRPLGDVADAVHQALIRDGVPVRLRSRVDSLAFEQGRVRGVHLADGQTLLADVVVAAVPPAQLSRLVRPLPDSADLTGDLDQFGVNPILNVYLWFSRAVMSDVAVATVKSPLQFVFNRGELVGGPAGLIALSLSAAREWVGIDKGMILNRLLPELRRILPDIGSASLERARLVWQSDATVVLTPDAARRRARPETAWPGLTLAGDWTATDWPCSMESAIISGARAVRAALA